jgi:hypothetical protein
MIFIFEGCILLRLLLQSFGEPSIATVFFNLFITIDRLCGLATDPEARVRFPALPDFPRSLAVGPLTLVSTTEELL